MNKGDPAVTLSTVEQGYGRTAFEVYAHQMGSRDCEETSEGGIRRYTNPHTQIKWNIWRASRDALHAKHAKQPVIDGAEASGSDEQE